MFRSLLFVFIILKLSCTYYEHDFPYNFEKVEELVEFHGQLDEISGLFYKNSSILYAVQDEEGEIFEINLKTKTHKKIIDFKKKGDFEGIARFEEKFYALESDGDIFIVQSEEDVEKVAFFDDDDDFEFEGLTVDKDGEYLLVSCKKHGKKDEDKFSYVYQFSIEEEKYEKEPYLKIARSEIHENFRSSGVSINENGNLVLISGISNTIVEINSQQKVVRKGQLPPLIYPQAEGICFSPEGVLYIASEKGSYENGKIIKLSRID